LRIRKKKLNRNREDENRYAAWWLWDGRSRDRLLWFFVSSCVFLLLTAAVRSLVKCAHVSSTSYGAVSTAGDGMLDSAVKILRELGVGWAPIQTHSMLCMHARSYCLHFSFFPQAYTDTYRHGRTHTCRAYNLQCHRTHTLHTHEHARMQTTHTHTHIAGMFGFTTDFLTAQKTQQLAASPTECYQKADQHVSQATNKSMPVHAACTQCAFFYVSFYACIVLNKLFVCKSNQQCHGAMKAMGITIGKNGQLVIANKKAFETSNEPSHV